MMKKITIKLSLLLLLGILLCGQSMGDASTLYTEDLFRGKVGVPFTNWYDVADWEIKVCFDWGGDKDPNEVFSDKMQGDIYHDLVVALQAQVRNALPEEYEDYSDKRLYEVSWYIQPVAQGEDMTFEVYLVGEMGKKTVIGSDTSNYVNGFREYYAEYSNETYTKAVMKYWNARTSDTETVPIVE